MLGAIAGDVIGSAYEGWPVKTKDFDLFIPGTTYTDDTVLSVAIADAILHHKDYEPLLLKYGRRYPNAGYGRSFSQWLNAPHPQPYNSWGNGSAMRVSPIGFAFDSKIKVLEEARKSAVITHNHPEGIKGAQATALAVYLAHTGYEKEEIKSEIQKLFKYDLDRRLDDIRDSYMYTLSCQGSVPESIIAFLESTDYEDAVRNAISLGGDADTMACIAGSIAQAYYKFIPVELITAVTEYLPQPFLRIIEEFDQRFIKA
ncbi:MAG: ADP-ribosylglycohydrolase family protein [Gammaproteobacteria bacterium]|nr:ADP-ribosylglycohydrolase family protein [Gammaproteobacteria bacterium]